MKAPTYITYSEKVPNQHSRMPATPAAKAKMRAPLAFLSAAAPRTTLKMAWPTIMTEVMTPPTTATSKATSVSDLV